MDKNYPKTCSECGQRRSGPNSALDDWEYARKELEAENARLVRNFETKAALLDLSESTVRHREGLLTQARRDVRDLATLMETAAYWDPSSMADIARFSKAKESLLERRSIRAAMEETE